MGGAAAAKKKNPETGDEEEVGFRDPGVRLIFTKERDSVLGSLTVSASWHNRTYLSTPWKQDAEQVFSIAQQQQQQQKKKGSWTKQSNSRQQRQLKPSAKTRVR